MLKSKKNADKSTIAKYLSLISDEKVTEAINSVKNKDITICLGNSGFAKSTVVNQLIGNLKKDPSIEKKPSSEITIPSVLPSSEADSFVVDVPEFKDKDNGAQDAFSSFFIDLLLKNANSVKFTTICDINDVVDKAERFTSLIEKFTTMLPQSSVIPSLIMVFTKNKKQMDKTGLIDIISKKIIPQCNTKLLAKHVIEEVAVKRGKVVVVDVPEKPGKADDVVVNQDLLDVIKNQTDGLVRNELKSLTVGMTDMSKCFIAETRDQLKTPEDFKLVMSKVVEGLQAILNDILQNAKTDAKERFSKIGEHLTSIRNVDDLFEVLKSLQKLIPTVEELKDGSPIYLKLKLVQYNDHILGTDEFKTFLETAKDVLKELSDVLVEITLKILGNIADMGLEEMNKQTEKLFGQFQKKIQKSFKKLNNKIKSSLSAVGNLFTRKKRVIKEDDKNHNDHETKIEENST